MLLKLAWRNIWRNKRRSIITIAAMSFAVMLFVAMRGLQLGTYAVNIRTSVELFSGYLQLQKKGYQQNPTLYKSFPYTSTIDSLLRAEPAISGYAPRITAGGLISYRENSYGVMIFGIDPAREQKVAKIFRKVDQGRFFAADTTAEIVVGYKLLDNLQAHIGDTVVVLSQGYDGSLGNLKFRIVGSVKTGFPEMDGAVVLMGLSTAQDLLTLYGRVSLIAISLESLDDVFPVQRRLNARLPDPALVVLNWQEIMPDLAQAIELDNVSGFIFSALLVLIVGFGIMNTVLMSVTERFREFGVSLAIGMPNRMLVYLIFLETACLAVIGLVLGNLMGAAINLYIVHHPIVFTGEFAQLYQEYGFLPRLESTLKPIIFISATLVTGLIALLACLYPAYRVFKLEPLRGIRYT